MYGLLLQKRIWIENNHPISGYWKAIVRVCQVSKYLLQSTPTTNSFSVTVVCVLQVVSTPLDYSPSIHLDWISNDIRDRSWLNLYWISCNDDTRAFENEIDSIMKIVHMIYFLNNSNDRLSLYLQWCSTFYYLDII